MQHPTSMGDVSFEYPEKDNFQYENVFRLAYETAPPQTEYLSPEEIKLHVRRVDRRADRPFWRLLKCSHSPSEFLDLHVDKNIQRTVDTLIIEIILAAADQRYLGISLNKNTYSNLPGLSYRHLIHALRVLKQAGLIYFFKVPALSIGPGICSFASATPLLLEEVAHRVLYGFSFRPERDASVVIWRDKNGHEYAIPPTGLYYKIRREMRQQNQFMESVPISLSCDSLSHLRAVVGDTQQRHIFTKRNDNLPFHRCGGRMYGAGYQNQPKIIREKITINGEPTVEPDYSSLHPTLLRKLVGRLSPSTIESHNPYDFSIGTNACLEGWSDRDIRSLNKFALLVALNAPTPRKAIGAIAAELTGIVGDRRVEKGYIYKTAKDVYYAAARHNSDLECYFGSDVGIKLQSVDAQISQRIQTRGRKDGVPVLNVHDSFRVPENREAWITYQMEAELKKAVKRNEGAFH